MNETTVDVTNNELSSELADSGFSSELSSGLTETSSQLGVMSSELGINNFDISVQVLYDLAEQYIGLGDIIVNLGGAL